MTKQMKPLFVVYQIADGKSAFSGRTGPCVTFSRRGDNGDPKVVTVNEFLGFLKMEQSVAQTPAIEPNVQQEN